MESDEYAVCCSDIYLTNALLLKLCSKAYIFVWKIDFAFINICTNKFDIPDILNYIVILFIAHNFEFIDIIKVKK